MEDCIRQNGLLHELPELDKIYVVNVNNVHWIVLTNIDPQNREPNDCFYNFDNNQWCQQNWYVYDSLNNPNNCQATSSILRLIYPERKGIKVHLVNVEPQVGQNDCGLFAISYAQVLSYGRDPYNYRFNQSKMRETYNFFINYDSFPTFEFFEISNKSKILNEIVVNF
ncbi:unnamed protein product [Brachionus calyciflorus]|uniref:Ubiquitin-like protease family profile domain-containing protein n=1 Tax=Brachionus calyciflorus TaxID=104777 RepID=A0A814LG60_9BILA|nr:unnamed protein product [Brachionus calyciflorus]